MREGAFNPDVTVVGPALAYGPCIAPTVSFEDFYRKEFPRLAGSLRLVCGDDGLAEELAQEAFARTLNHWSRVQSFEKPAGWVYRVGFNLLRKYWKRNKYDQGPLVNEPVVNVADSERIDLMRVLERLPMAQREAIVMRFILDMTTDAIAEEMNMKPGTLRMTLHRAVETLRNDAGLQLDLLPESTREEL